jgi:hypothetical protein
MDHNRRRAVEAALAAAAGFALATLVPSRRALAGRAGLAAAVSDVDSMNALLEAELDAIATYTSDAAVLTSADASDPNAAIAPTVLAVATQFQSHHKDHAAALTSLIKASGGTPVASGTAQIPTGFKPSVLNVIGLAANAERAAAIAYVSTLKTLSSTSAATLAASIGGVEAEHFVFLYALADGLLQGTALTTAMATSVVPTSFIVQVGAGTSGLDGLTAFTFG